MKTLLLFAAGLMVAADAGAAHKPNTVSVSNKFLTLSFVQQPLLADGKLLPLIDGTATAAPQERFGVYLGNVPASAPVLEILEGDAVTKSLTVNDLVGKGIPKEETVLPKSQNPRRAENIYTVRLPGRDVQVIVKAIATGDASGPDQQLVLTFALKGAGNGRASLRLSLPYAGNASAVPGGFVITSTSGTAALGASVYPKESTVSVEKGRCVITGASGTIESSGESALLWLVITSAPHVGGSSPSDVKSQAQRQVMDWSAGHNEPRLIVVNTADKERLQQADTATYSIICANIGNGSATNIVLGNPVPKGTRYVEGSATTRETVFGVSKGNLAEAGESLHWKLSQPLKPGEERIVSFKVVVQ